MKKKVRLEKKRAMTRLMKRRSQKAGLPPGSLVHIGEQAAEESRLTLVRFDESGVTLVERATPEACIAAKGQPGVAWIAMSGLKDVELIRRLGEAFGLHPLVQEDLLNTDQRPKLEGYGDYVFMVLKTISPGGAENAFTADQIGIVLGPNYVLTFAERASGLFQPIEERIRADKSRHRREGPDYLAYTLLDVVVDRYFAVLESFGERLELLEEDLVTNPTRDTLQTMLQVKRDLIYLRRAIWPLREAISALGRDDSGLVRESTRLYLRDVYDHTVQVIDIIETFRDMASGMLDIYLSSLSNKMNEVMKVLTVIATIFIPLTFVSSLYGMNFKYMPELEWKWGYAMVWAIMVCAAALMLAFFRRKRWI